MAQVSYGTITITDTNDIESIVVEYNRNQSTSSAPAQNDSGWSTNRPAWAQGYYIWQRTRIHKSGTSATEDTFGTAVCLTGSTGQTGATGKGITGVETLYATNNSTTIAPTSGWQSQPPTYNSSNPKYWVKVTTTYNVGDPTVVTYLDNGITDAMATAAVANQTANSAKDKADTIESNLNNYITSNNNVVTALQTRTKYFWTNLVAHTNGSSGWTKPNYPVGTYAASGISGTTFDEENSSTYGYNTLYSNGIKLRYNAINLGELTGTSLVFYRPSTTAQGSKGMELTSSTLKFYDATGTVAQATFGGTQAIISGTINAYDGKIGNDTNNYWYIGNYTDYNQNDSAIIKSKGTASIQLDETNTWRISTNRIHTAWAPETGTDAFKLHFPKFNDSSSTNKYWDYGLHLPTSYGDKFLYIRNASGSETLDNLLNDLDDNGYNYWSYKFYIDGEGNIHAGDIYSHDTLISGTSAPYLLKSGGTITGNLEVNGTLTKGNKNVAYLTATPTSGQILVADGTGGGVKTSGYTIAKSVPSTAVFTDQNVQTSQANTTKIYLVGTSTAGTSTGTLNFDSNVYIDTTAGALKATTFNGYTLAAASAKGVDTSISDASTSTNLPTSQAVAAFVEGKGYKTTDNNTTYTFANGTNGFTVTPSGGTAQTVTVTPSITNNVTGSGTNGYLVKWSGTNTVTNGPQLSSNGTGFLRQDGTWATPGGTYSLPLAANGTRGGVQIGYTQSGKNYPVQLSSEKMYVNVPWENTTYSAGTGLSLNGTTINHSNSVTAGTAGTSSATSGATLAVPYVTYDAQGHVTGSGTHTHTINNILQADVTWGGPALANNATPDEVATIDDLGHNKFAFMSAASVEVHYSRDNGSTWTAYGTDNERRSLVTLSQGFRIGGPNAGKNATVNDQLRVQLNANIAGGNIYCNLRRILIYLSTSGSTGCTCTVQTKTIANYNNNVDTWTTAGTYSVSGWSGWNSIPFSGAFGGSSTQTVQIAQIRLIFKATSVVSTSTNLEVSKIRGVAFPLWVSPSTMANTGHLYSYDIGQNATFPAKVTATGGFSGNVTGTATGNLTSVQYDSINKKITYTKNSTDTDVVTVATLKTDLGSMPASDVYSWAKASTKPSYSYSEIGSAPDAIIDATVNESGVIVLTKNSGGTIPLSTEIAVVESQGANKLVEAGTTTGISVGSAAEPVYFSSGVPVKGNTIPKLNNTTTGGTFYAPTAVGTAKQILVSSGNAAPTWQTVATGGTNGTIKIGSDEYSVKGLAAAAYKGVVDSSSASAIGTGTNVTTERDVYYGLPTINNAHNYTSSTTIYAPTAGGTSSQVLIGNGTTSAPVWTDISGIVPSSATNATNATYATYDASEANNTTKVTIADKYILNSIGTAAGDIIYWSASGTPVRLAKGSNGQVLKLANGVPTWGTDNNDNTWRTVQVDGTDILGSGTGTGKLNLKAGSNVTITNSSGTVTIASSYTNTDTKVNVKTRGTTKAYILGTTTSPTSSNQAVESVAETGVYFDTTAGKLVATTFSGALSGNASTATSLNGGTALSSKNLNDYHDTSGKLNYYYAGGTNSCTNVPIGDGTQFGMITYNSAGYHVTQELSSFSSATNKGKWIRWYNNSTWTDWEKFLTSANYSDYTVTKTGGGASGTWGISISGEAANVTGTVAVSNGGTGATSFTANSVIISGSTTTAALTTRAITNVTSGAVTASTNLVTANSLVAHVANKIAAVSDAYVTIATDQTITASQKTFNGAIRWGTSSKYGAVHYDSTLEAIVFSFA